MKLKFHLGILLLLLVFSHATAQEAIGTRTIVAVKSNLLFDIALMPNLELEVPIGNRWSVAGEYMFPWWLIDGNKYCLQILAGCFVLTTATIRLRIIIKRCFGRIMEIIVGWDLPRRRFRWCGHLTGNE